MKLPIMPDLPSDYVRFLNDNPEHIIFDERFFIKKVFANEYDPQVLQQLQTLKIPNYNNPQKLFIDENYTYLYIVSKYLKNTQSFLSFINNCSKKEILLLYKTLLTNLKEAHQKEFIPYDIDFRNYLIDENNQPIFIDFDISLYQGKKTWLMLQRTIFELKDFQKNSSNLSKENLILNDKMLVLNMLLLNLCPPNFYYLTLGLKEVILQYKALLDKYEIDQSVKEYLNDIIINKMAPQPEDYFIENLIDPLIEKQPTLKKL